MGRPAKLSSLNPDKRPVFAEGLASSYEAFLNTRKKDWEEDPLDLDEIIQSRIARDIYNHNALPVAM